MTIERISYERDSFIDPRIEVRKSNIHGSGIFTNEPIKQREIVIVWGGVLFTERELCKGKVRPNSPVEVAMGVFLAEPINGETCEDELMNHSCYPNLWMVDEITLAAKRDIQKGEELTLDYAMFYSTTGVYEFECRCGSSVCRGAVTRNDWQREDLQQRYKNHFSPYLNKLILATSV